MSSTPSTKAVMTEPSEVAAEFVPLSGQGVSSQGVGEGSAPGLCGSPAEAGRVCGTNASAHTIARVASSFLIVDSPVEMVEGRGRFATKTLHCTPATDPDLVLFRSIADRKDFDALTQLCRERLLTARDQLTSFRWTKDRSIAEAMRGNYTGSYDLLASVHYFASTVTGAARGKYESQMGITLARLGRSSLAIGRFNVGYQNARSAGDLTTCARIDTARARALVTRGEKEKAMRYISRALAYARGNNDYRLEMEICESLVEFG